MRSQGGSCPLSPPLGSAPGHRSYRSQNSCTCRCDREGRDRYKDQGHPEVRASLEQVEMKMEDKYHPEKFEAKAPDGHHRNVSF